MNFNLDFLRFRFIALIASVAFILVSLATISIQQLQLGLDFTGGTLVEVGFTEAVDPEEIAARHRLLARVGRSGCASRSARHRA